MKFGITRPSKEPAKSLSSFRKDIDRLFDDFFNVDRSSMFESQWLPEIDVFEDDGKIVIRADVAGIEEKDLDVKLDNNILTISGKREEEKRDSGKSFIISERHSGCFTRSIALPEGVKADDVKADLKNGVLKICVNRHERLKSKQIKIDVK